MQEFIDVFAMYEYYPCLSAQLESGYEKIALYIKDGVPEHAARQLPNGAWTSKLGQLMDIEHVTLSDLPTLGLNTLMAYGSPSVFFRRRLGFKRRLVKRIALALNLKIQTMRNNPRIVIATR